MPTFNEEQQRIKQELDTIEAVLHTELKKTFIGRWLVRLFLDANWMHRKHTHKKEKDPVLQMFKHDEI